MALPSGAISKLKELADTARTNSAATNPDPQGAYRDYIKNLGVPMSDLQTPEFWAAHPELHNPDAYIAAGEVSGSHGIANFRMSQAFKQAAPEAMAQLEARNAASDTGILKDFSDLAQQAVGNFTPIPTDILSERAQAGIDPGLKTVSTIAGLGALYGANNPQGMVDPVTGINEAGMGVDYAGGGSGLLEGAAAGTAAAGAGADLSAYGAGASGTAGTYGTGEALANTAANAGLDTVGAIGAGAASAATPAMGALGTALTQAGVGLGVNLLGQAIAPEPDKSAGEAAKTTAQIAKEQWDYYKQNYQPLEMNLIDQAQKAGSPEEFAAAAGRANADVTGGFDKANKAVESRMQAYGINPGSPRYQSTLGSVGLAEGAAHAGAQTEAYNNQKNLAYSKALDVAGLGKGIPAQSAASSAAASNAASNASNTEFKQNTVNQGTIGSLLEPFKQPLTNAATDWYGSHKAQPQSTTDFVDQNDPVFKYAKGGKVGLEALMKKKGMHPDHAKMAITPHMRRKFANGGGVGTYGLEDMNAPSQENQVIQGAGTETSDSIPAEVDGQEPAALSTGEFVMAAPVMKMSGEQILQAINNAGLEMREPTGAMEGQYAEGGQVRKPEEAPIGSGMAKKTAEKISARKRYEEEALSSAEEGKQIPSFDEWFASAQHYARGGKVNRYCHAGL